MMTFQMNGDPEPLSAKNIKSFAYKTVKDRLPVIVTSVVDTVYRQRRCLAELYGSAALEDCKKVAGLLSRLRNELQTDKALLPLISSQPDTNIWNSYLEKEKAKTISVPPSWFKSPWLYVECYLYRRIIEIFEQTKCLMSYDPFMLQKKSAFQSSYKAIDTLMDNLRAVIDKLEQADNDTIKDYFLKFFQIALWGNKCDLSISLGSDNSQTSDPLEQLSNLKSNILVNHSKDIWNCLQACRSQRPGCVNVHIVLDNAGFELVTDFCLAEFLLSSKLVDTITFYVKSIPWFVSDVTLNDFHWTIEQCTINSHLTHFGKKWMDHISDRSFRVIEDSFWTLPYDFSEMKIISPSLYSKLSEADIIIMKGDLNYRKLVGDRNWMHTTSFEFALRGFHPAPLCILRTLKADVVVGLPVDLDKEIEQQNDNWMVSGDYAVIEFCSRRIN